MKFNPIDISSRPPYLYINNSKDSDANPSSTTDAFAGWIPVLEHGCDFPDEVFIKVMVEMISNPNYNSSLLLRADILYDHQEDECRKGEEVDVVYDYDNCRRSREVDSRLRNGNTDVAHRKEDDSPRELAISSFSTYRRLVRRFVPRNPKLDKYLLQTCLFLRRQSEQHPITHYASDSVIVYIPHASAISDIPFYHPPVKAIAFLHTPNSVSPPNDSPYTISIHYLPFIPPQILINNPNRLNRTFYHLLEKLHKHGQGLLSGYVKRVQHNIIIPRNRLEDTYLGLKAKHAQRLIDNWVESTDPKKHVFEDLLIASFLIELWKDMYSGKQTAQEGFPGFVDIGCGNGLLVDILRREGYDGYGFDARKRKTWDILLSTTQAKSDQEPWLRENLLIPYTISSTSSRITALGHNISIHDGRFPTNTFLISNHADQLTGWTPLLASLCQGGFLTIPCCSYNLSGDKFRHKAIKHQKTESGEGNSSQYAALCAWTEDLAKKSGYIVEKEILRIPSTRNVGILGRRFRGDLNNCGVEDRIQGIIDEEGGVDGWVEKVQGLVKSMNRH